MNFRLLILSRKLTVAPLLAVLLGLCVPGLRAQEISSPLETLHISHKYANVDAQSLIGLPMGSHKTIIDKSGDLKWSQWSLARRGLDVNFGFSQQLDGMLGIQLVASESGSPARPLTATSQHLDQGHFPFVVTHLSGGRVTAQETAFAVSSGGVGMDVVLVQAENPGDAEIALDLRLNGKVHNLPAHVVPSRQGSDQSSDKGSVLATDEGLMLAVVEPKINSSQVSSETGGLTLVEHRRIPAHGSVRFWIEVPYEWPLARESSLPVQSGPELLTAARQSWIDLWSQGAKIELPRRERELSDFYLSSLAYVLILTERDARGDLWTLDGPAEYRQFWGRGEYFQGRAMEVAGYLATARASVEHTFSLQKPDGEWDWPVVSGWPAWDNIGGDAASVWDYYEYSRDKQWLASAYPYLTHAARWITLHRQETELGADTPAATLPIRRPAPSICAAEPNPPLKPGERTYWWGLLPWGYGDSGLPSGHPFPHNVWALYAIEVAERAAVELGKTGDAVSLQADSSDYKNAILTAMRRAISLEREDAPYLPAMPTYPNAGVSQSLIAVYPTGFLSPDNPWVTNLLNRMQRTELQGLPTDMAWMGRSGVWPGESMNVAETYLRRGNVDKTVELLLASLEHSYSTNVWKEEIKVDKTLPVACTTGSAAKIPDGHGTGDMPEAWGNANLVLLVRDMLLRDDGGQLRLLSGIPASWIAPGEHIEVSNGPTIFGNNISFRLDDVAPGEMKLHVQSPAGMPAVLIRLPLNPKQKIQSVTLNGLRIQAASRDMIGIHSGARSLDIDIHLVAVE